MREEFVGKTFPTPKGGILTVTGWLHNIRKGQGKIYTCSCSICSLDTELFSCDFTITKGHLNSGRCPCACTGFKWNEHQQVIRVSRLCRDRGYTFNGWSGPFTGITTKLDLYNPVTKNSWDTTTIDYLVYGKGDPSTRTIKIIEACKKVWVGKTMESSKCGKITIIEEVGKNQLKIHCDLCEKDPELFGDGTFITTKSGWTSRNCSCGCFGVKGFTEEQWLVLIKRSDSIHGKSRFKNLVGTFTDGSSKITQTCLVKESHKDWSTGCLKGSVVYGKGCPRCAGGGYEVSKAGNFYLVEWFNKDKSIHLLKLGVTNRDVIERVGSQNDCTSLNPKILYTWNNKDGGFVLSLETELKRKYKDILGVDREVLRDGFSEATEFNEDILTTLVEEVTCKLGQPIISQNTENT